MQKSKTVDVIIIGAGLSGLTAAAYLHQAGKSLAILEARDRIGGRIHSVPSNGGRFDLGPTWFWGHQQNIIGLLHELELDHFQQYEDGDSFFEQRGSPPQRFTPNWEQPVSHRIAGGVMSLIDALANLVDPNSLHLSHAAESIRQSADGIEVITTSGGQRTIWQAKNVLVTLPPHLAATTIEYTPALPSGLSQVMQQTPTWMGEAMKVSLVYKTPFWREKNISGMAISYEGPVQQFHDASPADSEQLPVGALFGWIGNQPVWRMLSAADRQAAVIQQAIRLFGAEAGEPLNYAETNWENEPFTTNSNDPDRAIAQQHPRYGHPLFHTPQMDGRLWWATTEASPVEGGYLDGAIYIGRSVAAQIAK